MHVRKILQSLTLTGFVFGLVGFLYIAGNAWFHPESLSWPLTHHFLWPREDDFAVMCFATSAGSFFVYNLIKDDPKTKK